MDKVKIIIDMLKENTLYFVGVIAVTIAALVYIPPIYSSLGASIQTMNQEKETKTQLTEQRDNLKMQQDIQNRSKKVVKEGKVIYEAKGMQFSPDASFAPLFELVLTIAQQSGIRIRSIDYNYAPQEDIIYSAKLNGYNSATLSIVAVGTYSEFQTFFKSVMKEPYLTNFSQVEINPWDKDKKILINKFDLTLYTKTIN